MNQPRGLVFFSMLFTLLMLAGCSAGRVWMPRTGQVLDWETREPIVDAVVVARWYGKVYQIAKTSTVCYHVESAVTDKQGRYRIPAEVEGPKGIYDANVYVSAYKAGYRESIDVDNKVHRSDIERGVYYLEIDRRDASARIQYLDNLIQNECFEENEKELIPLYQALLAEIDALGESADSDQIAKTRKSATYHLDVLLHGWDYVNKKYYGITGGNGDGK